MDKGKSIETSNRFSHFGEEIEKQEMDDYIQRINDSRKRAKNLKKIYKLEKLQKKLLIGLLMVQMSKAEVSKQMVIDSFIKHLKNDL